MKNLGNRIARLEQRKGNHIVNQYHELACRFAEQQGKPKPEKPSKVIGSMKQLAGYLPN